MDREERLLLAELGIELASHVVRLGPAALPDEFERPDPASINATADDSPVRCLDPQTAEAMIAAVKEAGKASDTLGGVAEIVVGGLPVGLGSHVHWDRKLDGRLAGALMAVPSVKGVEIGLGFANAERPGSRVHDEIVADADKSGPRRGFRRLTNNAGGLEGGITNGERLVLRAAGKPISTLMKPLRTVDVRTGEPAEAMTERSDIVVTPALGVVCEAVVCLVLADAIVEKFGGDTLGELKHNFESYLLSEY